MLIFEILVLMLGILRDSQVNEESVYQATTVVSTLQCDDYSVRRLEGVIKMPFRSRENVTGKNGAQCFLKHCRCGSRCVVSFHPPSRSCVTSAPFFELLSMRESGSLIEQTPGEAWVTYRWVSNDFVPNLTTPSGLWLFDNVHGERNFGVEGRHLDGVFLNVKWTEEGPRGRKSPLKYPLFSRQEGSIMFVPNKHNGKYLIDFSKPFTIAMWVKVVNKGSADSGSSLGLFECPRLGDGLGFYLKDIGTSARLALRFKYSKHYYVSVEFNFRYNEWRHFAAVYNGPRDVLFYSNGSLLELKGIVKVKTNFVRNPNRICFWVRYPWLPSSVACLSIFTRPLSKSQVAHLMRKCP